VDADVLICGLGPVGQLLALLLGDLGVAVIAVDEADEPYDLPRAAVVDDEVLRIFQSAGVDGAVLQAAQVQPAVSFVTAGGRALQVLRTEDGDLGQPPLVSIHQPSMERALVAALSDRPTVDLRWGQRLLALDRDAEGVTAQVRPTADGPPRALRARYLVGCDGGRSAVRGSVQIPFGGSTFAQRWVVIDALLDRPLASAPHPHFHGDTGRPTVCLPMSPGRHRWEFMLHGDEDAAPFLEPERMAKLMAPWIADEHVEIERAVIYTFHARTAERWRAGRVLLAGDAAHVMPPFVGQGFSSGARDAANLAWKLDAVLRGTPARLLDTYEQERRPHVTSMQKLAVRWGGIVQTADPRVGRRRDRTLQAVHRVGVAAWIEDRAKPLPTYGAGAFAHRPSRLPWRRAVGSLFPQPTVDGTRLDELLVRGWTAVATTEEAAAALRGAGVETLTLREVDWLERRGLTWALLRPDRFVFACGATPFDTGPAIAALRATMGDGLRSGPAPARAVAVTA
jgi:3-(3-hydroxy-phenyl)propionate hydroxylase